LHIWSQIDRIVLWLFDCWMLNVQQHIFHDYPWR